MSRRTRRFIVTTEPVNRRTCTALATRAAGNSEARGRIVAARSRLELGLPLGQQLQRGQRCGRVGRRHVAAMLLAITGLVLLFVAALLSDGALGALALALAPIVAAALMLRRRDLEGTRDAPVTWLDDPVLQAFDRLLAAIADDVEPRHRERLCEIKVAVVGIARGAIASDKHATTDDRHYVVECLRRYLPDLLTAYLAVPQAQRHDSGLQMSAIELLDEQLRLLRDELRRRARRAAVGAMEDLLRQRRFLASKRDTDRSTSQLG